MHEPTELTTPNRSREDKPVYRDNKANYPTKMVVFSPPRIVPVKTSRYTVITKQTIQQKWLCSHRDQVLPRFSPSFVEDGPRFGHCFPYSITRFVTDVFVTVIHLLALRFGMVDRTVKKSGEINFALLGCC